MQHIKKDDNDGETFWKYKRISGHEGPLVKGHPSWKGDKYNVKVEWETGEVAYDPLHTIATDDPVTCAIYAKDNDLLDTEGWIRRMVNQSKLQSYKACKKYIYGIEIPRNYAKMQSALTNCMDNYMSTIPFKTEVLGPLLGRDIRRFVFILFMRSNMMADTKRDCVPMGI